MFCPNCGKEIMENQLSAPVSPANPKSFCKAFIITLIAAILLATFVVLNFMGVFSIGIGASRSGQVEGPGYESPKACALDYMEYMKNADYAGMLSCYAIESAVEHFDMVTYVERMQCLSPVFNFISNEDEFEKEMSCEQLRGRVFSLIRNGSWYLAGSDFLTEGLTIPVEDYDDDVKEMMEDKIPSDFKDTLSKIEHIKYLDEDNKLIEKCVDNDIKSKSAENQIAMMGADDFAHGIVDFSLGDEDYYLMLEFVEYDDKWYIVPSNSYLSNIYGIAPVTGNITNQDSLR